MDFSNHPRHCSKKLAYYGIHVPKDHRSFQWFAVFDFESILERVNIKTTENLEWTQKHVPVSTSICSNVPTHNQPICIVEPDLDSLVKQMVEKLNSIAESVHILAEQRWGTALEALKEQLKKV